MTNNNITLQEQIKLFAIRSIKVYSKMNSHKNLNDSPVFLAKQFLRSSPYIGAN